MKARDHAGRTHVVTDGYRHGKTRHVAACGTPGVTIVPDTCEIDCEECLGRECLADGTYSVGGEPCTTLT